MAEYLTPGIYLEEAGGDPPIVGVGTSTAGFIGQVDTGPGFVMPPRPDGGGPCALAPVDEPRLATSFSEFTEQFGDFQTGNLILAHAVSGFFHNGGTRCWVARTADLADAAGVSATLASLAAIDEIALLAAPGARASAVQEAIIAHCSTLQNRFAILDGQVTTERTPAAIRGGTGDSAYAALYYPQIQVHDPVGNALISIPASAHIAGIYARVDARRGVHKAPANEEVRGALGLDCNLSGGEQDRLNPEGINCIRSMSGFILVWGARTLGGDANGMCKYISVRRTLIYLRESIGRGIAFAAFEPSGHSLRDRITRLVSDFLIRLWRDGVLLGAKPEQAFFVRCDETTTPPDMLGRGQNVIEIGVAALRPAEFLLLRITQTAAAA